MRGEEMLSGVERENMLIKLDKEFAFAGATIPEEMEVEGERIRLKAFTFEVSKKRGRLSQAEMEEVDRVIALAIKRRREIVARLSREELTKAEARRLYEEARGLDRALDTLYAAPLPKQSVKEEANRAKLEDGRRWLSLIRKVYSREDKRRRE
jgi:hypothetical protein